MLGTLNKLGAVLDLFTPQRPEVGTSEVAKELCMPKSSAHLLLASMTSIGLLCRTSDARYRLGWRMLALGRTLLETTEVRRDALGPMQDVVVRFGETVNLAILDGNEVVYIEKLQGASAVQVALTWVGKRLPPHCTAVGKVLLASRPWEEVQEILGSDELPAFTYRTVTSLDKLQGDLQQVAQQGYACDLEEVVPDLCCIAAPVRDYTGEVIAAMSLSIPAYRFDRKRDAYRMAIVHACQETSRALGYLPWNATKRGSNGQH